MLKALRIVLVAVNVAASPPADAGVSQADAAAQRRLATLGGTAGADSRIGANVRVDGQAMSVRHAMIAGEADEIVRRLEADGFRRSEASSVDGGRRSGASPWRILAKLDGQTLETWQVRPAAADASEVIVSVAALDEPRRHTPPSPLGLPPGGRLVSTTESSDRGRLAVQHLVHVRLPPSTLREWVRSTAAARGWREAWAGMLPNPQGGFVLVHRRGRFELTSIAAAASGGVRLMFNETEEMSP